jgi:hypothetical protein
MKTGTMTAVVAAAVATFGAVPQDAAARGHSSSAAVEASLESRLNAMEAEMQALRSELAAAKAETQQQVQETAQKVDATQQQQQATEERLAKDEEKEGDPESLLFFRGGFSHMSHGRNNELLINNNVLNALGATTYNNPNNGDGWYVGAGLDHRLTKDLWGMTDLVAVDGEVMFQYMNFGTSQNALVQSATGTIITGNGLTPGLAIRNQLTQFTLAASPKVKFNLLDGNLRPWIIPFGLSINVISPPSSGVTVLTPGLMLGTGIEYRLWKSLWAGADFRYNFTGGDFNYKARTANGLNVFKATNIDGLTAGAYLGFGF